jgi:hypothetical protein
MRFAVRTIFAGLFAEVRRHLLFFGKTASSRSKFETIFITVQSANRIPVAA